MKPYIPNTSEQQRAMLEAIGRQNMADLFEVIPPAVRLDRPLDLPPALSELEIAACLRRLASLNVQADDFTCFLGAGAYDHHIPAMVGHMLFRQEFYTSYTPYQPEISQGTLQAIFEFQSMICLLTGMDVANASMYDGATALAEAALMACRATGRPVVLVARSVHPEYRAVLQTYAHFCGFDLAEFGFAAGQGSVDLADLAGKINDNTAAVILQSPNFFGVIEGLGPVADLAHQQGGLLIAVSDPISLGLLKRPGEIGADIVVGEGQPLGLPLNFGGPYLGFFATQDALLRKMPGRIVGETIDRMGRRGYVLTMQAREQHIRRDKATSNICTNQGLCALAATIYLSCMGRQGLREVAVLCARKARYAHRQLTGTGLFSPAFSGPFFKEFAVRYPGDIGELNRRLLSHHILGGADLGHYYPELAGTWLVAVTEKRTRAEIDDLVEKAVLL